MEKEKNEEKQLYSSIFDLLSYEKFSFSGKSVKLGSFSVGLIDQAD